MARPYRRLGLMEIWGSLLLEIKMKIIPRTRGAPIEENPIRPPDGGAASRLGKTGHSIKCSCAAACGGGRFAATGNEEKIDWARMDVHPTGKEIKTMFKKKTEPAAPVLEEKKEQPTPAFLREDYPYKAMGEAIEELDSIEPTAVYEIKCPSCEMSIRSQGVNIKGTWERLQSSGCIGCGGKKLVVRKVDMSAAAS